MYKSRTPENVESVKQEPSCLTSQRSASSVARINDKTMTVSASLVFRLAVVAIAVSGTVAQSEGKKRIDTLEID